MLMTQNRSKLYNHQQPTVKTKHPGCGTAAHLLPRSLQCNCYSFEMATRGMKLLLQLFDAIRSYLGISSYPSLFVSIQEGAQKCFASSEKEAYFKVSSHLSFPKQILQKDWLNFYYLKS